MGHQGDEFVGLSDASGPVRPSPVLKPASHVDKLSDGELLTVRRSLRSVSAPDQMVMEFIDGLILLEYLHDNKDKALSEDQVLGGGSTV